MTVPSGRTVAVIDVGSNSVRLLVARALAAESFEVIDEERFDARLAEGQVDGLLTVDAMERGLRGLRVAAAVARSHNPSAIVAVGTEALRQASNADQFTDRAYWETGLRLRVLTPDEEGAASFLGAVNSTALRNGYLVDIGGGSLELVRAEERSLASAQSVPLGAIYAVERYLRGDPPTRKEVRSLRKAVRQQLDLSVGAAEMYAGGGAARNLARIVRARRRYPLRRLHGFVVTHREMTRLAAALAAAPSAERRKMPGVSPNRADILHAPAIVIDELMEALGATEICITGQGLREGLVWRELRGEGAVIEDVRSASVDGLALANGAAGRETVAIESAATVLFDAVSEAQALTATDRELLGFAARLSTIGLHLEYYNRDRHAEYLVHSGDLRGFSHREVVLLAAIMRWAETGTPDLSPYKAVVGDDDSRRAIVLASLLGAARAIHRRRPSAVREFSVALEEGEVRIRLTGTDALEPELLALQRQQKRLEQALDLTLVFEARSYER